MSEWGKWLYESSANLRVVLFLAGLLVCLHAALLHLNVRRDQSKHSTSTRKLTYIHIQQMTTGSRLECVCYIKCIALFYTLLCKLGTYVSYQSL